MIPVIKDISTLRIGDLLIGKNPFWTVALHGPFVYLGMTPHPECEQFPYTFYDFSGTSYETYNGSLSRPDWALNDIIHFTKFEVIERLELVARMDDRP